MLRIFNNKTFDYYGNQVVNKSEYYTDRLFIKVYETGSRGNCSLIKYNETIILVDMGISYKSLVKYLSEDLINIYNISCVLITHQHGDHKNALTIKQLKAKGIRVIDTFDDGDRFKINDIKIESFANDHDDLISWGFVFNIKGFKFPWVTDAVDLEAIPDYNYNLLAVEFNYHKKGLKKSYENGLLPKSVAKRIHRSHTSVEDALDWITNNFLLNLPLLPLHKSGSNIVEDRYYPTEIKFFTIKIE